MRYYIPLIIVTIGLVACKSSTHDSSHKGQTLQSALGASALSQQVLIKRTAHGVPHVKAETLEAAGFALGYLQMEDHAPRVVELLLKARGEWAQHENVPTKDRADAIDDDAASRLDYNRAIETWPLLAADTRDFISGFTKGVNRYIDLNEAEFTQWLSPRFTVYDVHARNIISPSNYSIRTFLEAHEEKKALSANSKNSAADAKSLLVSGNRAAQTVWANLAARAETPNPDVGSNVWAFGPQRTVSGNAILMRNPHLSWSAGYYEAHLNVPGKFNFYGDFRIGQAIGIIGGFNERLGWSTTNNSPDLDEVYSFQADPNKPDHYILDGVAHPITKKVVSVNYRFGNSMSSETREFWSTEHGPVILREDDKIYVMKSAGDGEFRTGEQFFKMMKAQNLSQWKAAMQMRARISSNLTYADADGNIFYVWNASMPNRPHESGENKNAFHVTSSSQMWQGFTRWDQLPQLENPKGDYLRNENDPFHFTNLNEVLLAENYPSFYPQPRLRLRSQLSSELIHNDKKFTLEDVVKLKHSERMLMADRVKPDLIEAIEQSNPQGELAQALALIKTWNNTAEKDSRGSVLFKTWWNRYVATADDEKVESSPESVGYAATPEKLFKQPWSYNEPTTTPYGLADYERALTSFQWATDKAKQDFGAWDLMWGDVHRTVIGDVDLPVGGCAGLLGCYRVLWFDEHAKDKQKLTVSGGDGWVFAVEFGDVPRAYSVLAYSQSSRETSPYFNDQLRMFTNGEMKTIVFTDVDINRQIVREYRPGEE
jgi:acyl-homoserine-lactone acylase